MEFTWLILKHYDLHYLKAPKKGFISLLYLIMHDVIIAFSEVVSSVNSLNKVFNQKMYFWNYCPIAPELTLINR